MIMGNKLALQVEYLPMIQETEVQSQVDSYKRLMVLDTAIVLV